MIHPSAIIHSGAQIGANCEIGPYCVIGEHVVLGAGNRLHSHVVVDGHTVIGGENEIFPFTTVGVRTQDLKWVGGTTWTRIGDHNTFREHVEIHSATGDGEATVIGSHNNILAGSHIAHNCVLQNHTILSSAGLAGHVPALHGLEPREQVLEDPRLDVVRAGLAVRRRRTLVEDPRLAVPGLLEAALEDPVTLPAGKHLVLERWQVDLGGELVHAGHAGCLRQWCSDEGTRLTPRGTTLLGKPLPARSCRAQVAQGVIFGLA